MRRLTSVKPSPAGPGRSLYARSQGLAQALKAVACSVSLMWVKDCARDRTTMLACCTHSALQEVQMANITRFDPFSDTWEDVLLLLMRPRRRKVEVFPAERTS